ncbi:PREDICTED: beta-taxilin isoform X2 [Nicrophorus vespilloides]|uniref:Beta-taxilin isoform X2 n=1 Tax=Nicrophorus vespilloides TaxID=110193 RepID=A0ABM1MMD2_NICVS|nr:PREDICTED: beta-taxilin isoform X2 [Nicrophorus vespilloides]
MLEMEDTKVENKTNGKKKREDKIRRRDTKALENILKSINHLVEAEKFIILKGKYTDLYDEYRTLQNSLTATEKKYIVLQREKDQLQSEHSKSILARSRLENLCREFQKQNKLIKEENVAKIREEESRKEVTQKFQNTLTELSSVMMENNEKNMKLRDDNIDMANKIATLCQQFSKGEEELARMSKQMSLEKQLSEATVAKAQFELKAERELWNKESEILKKKLQKSEETCTHLQSNIKDLESHLQVYTGKYEEFETTISKSNQVFDNCKTEMTKMTKQNSLLEKELKQWKVRFEKKCKLAMDMTASKNAQEMEFGKKTEQLQKLCRQLQVDRTAYLKLLKANNIEPSTQVYVEPTPPPPHEPTQKEQKLELLKNTLKILQGQFIELTGDPAAQEAVKAAAETEPVPVPKEEEEKEAVLNGDSVNESKSTE